MSNEEVLAHLRALHQQLTEINTEMESVEEVDEETIDALGDLLSDVGSLFDQAKSIQDQDTAARQKDLKDRIVRLETDHPLVTSFLSRMTDILGMMGI